jgi:ACS family hexuronate transporter-like MFS transporter
MNQQEMPTHDEVINMAATSSSPTGQAAGSVTPTRRQRSLRWRYLVLAVTASILVLNYADRSALAVAGPTLMKDLHMSDTEFGLLSSAFFVGYVPFCFIGGSLSDRKGTRSIMGLAVAWWSVFTALTAVGVGFVSLLVIRLLFGFGEGPQGAVSTKALRNWFPQREMGTAVGFAQGATPLGGAIGTPLVAALISASGGNWRLPFIILGLIGALCTVGWVVVVRDRPDLHPWATARDIEEASQRLEPDAGQSEDQAPPVKYYLRQPLVLATAFAFFGYAWVLYTFLSWFPTYLVDERHVDLNHLAIAGSVPWLVGVIGVVVGGMVTDRVAVRTGNPARARKAMIVGGLIVTAVLFAGIGTVTSAWAAVGLMSAVLFVLYLTTAQYFALIADVVAQSKLGSVMGFVHAIANLAGILAPAIVGVLVSGAGSWTVTFAVSGAVCILGAALLACFGRIPRPDAHAG